MYKVQVRIADSTIEGKGVFAEEDIPKDKVVWIFTANHDILMTTDNFTALPNDTKLAMEKTGYISPWSGYWVFPPANDPAQYTNHSSKNNLSAIFDAKVSAEPYFIANRNIKKGEELTNNYHEFDKITRDTKPSWAK